MSKFDYKKEITDSLKDGGIIAAVVLALFFATKQLKIMNPPTADLDVNDIAKLASGICLGVLVKDTAVYKKWINE